MLTTTKLVPRREETSKEAGGVPFEIPRLELSGETRLVTPLSPPIVGPAAPPQALPIEFLEDWSRIKERVSD